jgi:hypothetical protein
MDEYARGTRLSFVSYSQPNTFFRLPGRRNLHLGNIHGTTHWYVNPPENFTKRNQVHKQKQFRDISQMFFGISQDAVIASGHGFYFGVGAGPYVKESTHDFVRSKFMFGERAFVGYTFGQLSFELVAHHFSNGHLDNMNKGLNGVGVGASWGF